MKNSKNLENYQADNTQKKIIKILNKTSVDRQIPARVLLNQTGLMTTSDLRQQKINPMRLMLRFPIASSSQGYWWAKSKEELMQSAARIKAHGQAEIAVAEAIENSQLISTREALRQLKEIA